jgi:MFS family permease
MVTFFFASAAASAAYLTAGEIFPLEIRALAIAFFFAIGTGIGGVVGPWWFANLINEGRENLYLGFVVLSAAMTAAALIELIWGVAAERRPAGRCRATADFHQMIPWDLLRCVNSLSPHEVLARSKQDVHLQCNPSHTLYRTARL